MLLPFGCAIRELPSDLSFLTIFLIFKIFSLTIFYYFTPTLPHFYFPMSHIDTPQVTFWVNGVAFSWAEHVDMSLWASDKLLSEMKIITLLHYYSHSHSSLLSYVKKFQVKLVSKLVDLINYYFFVFDFQYVFKSSHSTEDLLTFVSDKIAWAFCRFISVLSLDWCKAVFTKISL